MNKLPIAPLATSCALAFALPLLLPSQAEACGGNFCDTGPMAMPVDQTGENILFKIDETSVEAHIQISIDTNTDAEKFAWVIPVTALPEFSVGSQILFDNMLQASVPSYGLQQNADFCGDSGDEGGDPATDSGTGDGDGDPGTGGGPEGPDVVFQGSVGAFEIAVLDGGTVDGVMTWLGDNGYEQDPNAEPILAQYLEEEFLFVALKLGVDADLADIHPIVIKYDGDEPCVPIRLTAIAAADDMDIRTFFLGEARVAPKNYRHVLVNPLKIDWLANGANYKEVITMAVDADEANGNAFVTEYAGPSNVISLANIYSDLWSAAPYAALDASPVGVGELLQNQDLMFCDIDWDQTCTPLHPLLQGILDTYIPVPENVDPVEFWTCMECYAELVDLEAWDAAAFAQTLDERIFQPGLHARDLVVDNPYLTRMYTTISPSEMNADPIFGVNTTLADVANVRWATQTRHCDGSTTVELPDGREVYFAPGATITWPDFQDEMPWEEDVDEEGMADNAPLINLVDNTEQIDQLLEEYNQQNGGGGQEGGTGGDAGANDAGLGGSGCACAVEDRRPLGGALLGFMTLGLMGLVRRRRR